MHTFVGILPFFLSLFLFSMPARAQHAFSLAVPEVGKGASERPVVETPDGGFALFFSGTGTEQTDSAFFGLAKFSPDGVPEWSRYVAIGTERIQPIALVQTADGGFAAAGTVVADSRDRELVLLYLNAHGQILNAHRYELDSLSRISDAFPLQDGSVLITGYLAAADEESWFDGPQVFVMRVERDGAIGAARRYPALQHFYTDDSKFRPLGNGRIALIGSILEPELFRHVGLVCEIAPEGLIRTATAFDATAPDGEGVGTVITDLLPCGDGQYTVLGECRLRIEHSELFSRQFTLSFNEAGRTEIPGRFYDRNSAVRFGTVLPGGEDRYLVAGGTGVAGELAIGEAAISGGGQGLTLVSVFPDSLVKLGLIRRPPTPFTCLPLSDRGILILAQEWDGPFLISRVPPDFTPCTGAPEQRTAADRADADGSEEGRSRNHTRSIEVSPIEFEVRSRPLALRAVDFPLEPVVICREIENALASTQDESAAEGLAAARLVLSPNSLRSGESCTAEFRLQEHGKPEAAILEIATGRTIREIPAANVTWANGAGSATIGTDGLSAGIYLVRVQSGEKQLTAKLEVR